MVDKNNIAQYDYRETYNRRVQRLLKICLNHDPVGLANRLPDKIQRYMKYWESSMDSGIHKNTPIEVVPEAKDIDYICHAVFSNKDDVEATLRDLKEADLGISIVVSGLFDEVADVCKKVGLEPHTVNMSLGTWGRTDLLPPRPVLELCTMCGHALVSSRLTERLLNLVEKGSIKPEEAAVELGKQCTCNVFNTERAVKIIKRHLKNLRGAK
jgi:hypothetical protein